MTTMKTKDFVKELVLIWAQRRQGLYGMGEDAEGRSVVPTTAILTLIRALDPKTAEELETK